MGAAQGSQGAGQVSDFLLRAGFTVEAVRNALNTIATSANANQDEVRYVTNELALLNSGRIPGASNTGTWVLLAAVGFMLWASMRND